MDASKLEYYTRMNEGFTSEDTALIESMYSSGKTIMDIGKELRKTPGQIAYKLKLIGRISNHLEANGYNEYKNIKLYAEMVGGSKENVGAKWSAEEEKMLLKELADGKKCRRCCKNT